MERLIIVRAGFFADEDHSGAYRIMELDKTGQFYEDLALLVQNEPVPLDRAKKRLERIKNGDLPKDRFDPKW